jgi:hypothetical protein
MAKAEKKPRAKSQPRLTDKAQSERFVQAAQDLGVDESAERFEEVFKKLVPAVIKEK